jgi:hypothetical protein
MFYKNIATIKENQMGSIYRDKQAKKDDVRIILGIQHRADFDIELIEDVIVITDLDKGSCSVTNDIEYVVQSIQTKFSNIDTKKIIYLDSTKHYDGIKQNKGKFISWIPLREKDLKTAISKIKGIQY